jgi:hypothetical protein
VQFDDRAVAREELVWLGRGEGVEPRNHRP